MPWLDWSCTVLYWTYCWWQPPMRVQRENRSRADLKKTDVRETVFGDLSLSTYLPAHPTWPESWCRHLYSDRQTGGKREGEKGKRREFGRKRNKCDRSVKVNRAEQSRAIRAAEVGQITIWNHFLECDWSLLAPLRQLDFRLPYFDILGNALSCQKSDRRLILPS